MRGNATCERLVGALRREFLDRLLILGEGHLRAVLAEYQVHYNMARVAGLDGERILRKPVLGGLLNEYARAAGDPEKPQVTRRILFSSGTG